MWHRIWREWDWTVVICTVLLISVGVVIIGSATHVNRDGLNIIVVFVPGDDRCILLRFYYW